MKKKLWLNRLPNSLFKLGMNLWPPFLGSGIKITKISPTFQEVEAQLKLHWFNRNYVGTHFGGSMFAMTDPFFMLILLRNLGRDYIVWDKAAAIEFKKPARGVLKAVFSFTNVELENIKQQANVNSKYIFDKEIDIRNSNNEIVATVKKTLYVKKKDGLENK